MLNFFEQICFNPRYRGMGALTWMLPGLTILGGGSFNPRYRGMGALTCVGLLCLGLAFMVSFLVIEAWGL